MKILKNVSCEYDRWVAVVLYTCASYEFYFCVSAFPVLIYVWSHLKFSLYTGTMLPEFPHDECGAAAKLRQANPRRQALSVGVGRLVACVNFFSSGGFVTNTIALQGQLW